MLALLLLLALTLLLLLLLLLPLGSEQSAENVVFRSELNLTDIHRGGLKLDTHLVRHGLGSQHVVEKHVVGNRLPLLLSLLLSRGRHLLLSLLPLL